MCVFSILLLPRHFVVIWAQTWLLSNVVFCPRTDMSGFYTSMVARAMAGGGTLITVEGPDGIEDYRYDGPISDLVPMSRLRRLACAASYHVVGAMNADDELDSSGGGYAVGTMHEDDAVSFDTTQPGSPSRGADAIDTMLADDDLPDAATDCPRPADGGDTIVAMQDDYDDFFASQTLPAGCGDITAAMGDDTDSTIHDDGESSDPGGLRNPMIDRRLADAAASITAGAMAIDAAISDDVCTA